MNFQQFRGWFSQCVASFMQLTSITTVDDGNDPQDTCEDDTELIRLESFGDIIVPPKGQRAASWRHNGGGYNLPLGSTRYRPKGAKPGTRGLYCSQSGTTIYLRGAEEADKGQIEITGPNGSKVVISKDGKITVDAAPGQDVVVNGGGLKVARDTDPVGYLVYTTVILPGPITVVASVGWSKTPAPPPAVSVPIFITGGADRFKG